jgi:serine/threonine-protein kinase
VLAQSPEADIMLAEGGEVQLVLSRGAEMTVIPVEVVGMTREQAESLLTERKLKIADAVPQDGNVPAGTVLAITPEPGKQVPAGSEVALVVASGKVQVPDVRGRTAEEATAELQRVGFSVGLQPRVDAGAPDLVLDQSPVAALAERGSTVVVVVSQPPPPPPSPSPSPPPLPEVVPDVVPEVVPPLPDEVLPAPAAPAA